MKKIYIHQIYRKYNVVGPFIFLSISVLFTVLVESLNHWFMVPVTLCGMILFKDAKNWITGKLDVFDPAGVISLLGLHLFYVAPILHVCWDSWARYVAPPPDWRTWLGCMGMLNAAGLLIFKYIVKRKPLRPVRSLRIHWRLHEDRFWVVCLVALFFTIALQVIVYNKFDGVIGYIKAYERQDSSFQGMGWIFMFSESFPILAFLAYAVVAKRRKLLRRWVSIVVVIAIFIGLKLLFGGLRGSRANTVWGLFWVAGIIHYWIRPLNWKPIIASLIGLVVFMYAYGLYKAHGLDALEVLSNPQVHTTLAVKGGRTFDTVLLWDLARSDVQAFLLYRLRDSDSSYQYKWGGTYLSSVMLLVPNAVRPKFVKSKREAGTEAQYGTKSRHFLSSRVYGLAGEAMLNWGFLSVPFAFAVFGLITAKLRLFMSQLSIFDARIIFLPVMVNLLFIMIIGDLDNVIFFLIKNGFFPFAVIWMSSQKYKFPHKLKPSRWRKALLKNANSSV